MVAQWVDSGFGCRRLQDQIPPQKTRPEPDMSGPLVPAASLDKNRNGQIRKEKDTCQTNVLSLFCSHNTWRDKLQAIDLVHNCKSKHCSYVCTIRAHLYVLATRCHPYLMLPHSQSCSLSDDYRCRSAGGCGFTGPLVRLWSSVCVCVCVCKQPSVYGVNGTVWLGSHCVQLVNGIYRVEFRRVEKVIRASCQAAASSEGPHHWSQVSARPDITAGQWAAACDNELSRIHTRAHSGSDWQTERYTQTHTLTRLYKWVIPGFITKKHQLYQLSLKDIYTIL